MRFLRHPRPMSSYICARRIDPPLTFPGNVESPGNKGKSSQGAFDASQDFNPVMLKLKSKAVSEPSRVTTMVFPKKVKEKSFVPEDEQRRVGPAARWFGRFRC